MLAEDSVLLREGLIALLDRFGHKVAAAVGDAPALLTAVAEHTPDIVVTDVRMPPGFQDEGLHAAVRLRERQPSLPVLVLSQYVQRTYAAELLDSGDGYLLKDRVGQVEDFETALQSVASGGTVVDPEVVRHLLRRRRDPLELLPPPRARGPRPGRRGQIQRGHSPPTRRLRGSRGQTHRQHPRQTEPPPADDTHRRVLAVLTYLRA